MSHVMSASAHQEPKEWSKEGFIRGMTGYSALLALIFGSTVALGHAWLHPTWSAPAACLVMALICLYSAHQEGKPSSTLAGVLGTMIFLGLAVGSMTALLNWSEVFMAVMTTVVIIAAISLVAFCFTEVFQDGWALAGVVIAPLLLAFVFWEFASETSRSLLGMGAIEMSPLFWVGIVIYVYLTAGAWRAALEEDVFRDHDNAIRAAADAVFIFAGIFSAVAGIGQLAWRQLSPKGDSDD